MATPEKASELVRKYNLGICTEQEKALLDRWYLIESKKYILAEDPAGILDEEKKMWAHISGQVNAGAKRKAFLWPRSAIAAAIAVVVLSFGLLYHRIADRPEKITYANDVAPGHKGATLRLANSQVINLKDTVSGQLAQQSGFTITRTPHGELIYKFNPSKINDAASHGINTLSTGRGETFMVILPDQSKIWLNAASSISYSTDISTEDVRRVKLQGEAYFEISKNKAHPFVVTTAVQEVEVLGTHFNISSYADEQESRTTLLEGSVKVKTLKSPADERLLVPGEQAAVAAGLTVNQADISSVMAWKNGLFIFKNQALEKIMKQVERWYDVEVVYQDDARAKTFWGTMDRFSNVSEVLQVLELTKEVHFKIEGRRITVMN